MTTSTSVCNLALDHLSSRPIVHIDDDTSVANRCKRNYGPLRDELLEAHQWTFASGRYALTAVANLEHDPLDPNSDPYDRTNWGEYYKFLIPSNTLVVRRVFDNPDFRNSYQADKWQIEGEFVVSMSEKIYVKTTEKVIDEDRFSPLFIQMLAYRLALQMCIPLTENRQLKADLIVEYDDKRKDAVVVDASQGRREQTQARRLTGIRRF